MGGLGGAVSLSSQPHFTSPSPLSSADMHLTMSRPAPYTVPSPLHALQRQTAAAAGYGVAFSGDPCNSAAAASYTPTPYNNSVYQGNSYGSSYSSLSSGSSPAEVSSPFSFLKFFFTNKLALLLAPAEQLCCTVLQVAVQSRVSLGHHGFLSFIQQWRCLPHTQSAAERRLQRTESAEVLLPVLPSQLHAPYGLHLILSPLFSSGLLKLLTGSLTGLHTDQWVYSLILRPVPLHYLFYVSSSWLPPSVLIITRFLQQSYIFFHGSLEVSPMKNPPV